MARADPYLPHGAVRDDGAVEEVDLEQHRAAQDERKDAFITH
jgi:hypothetical protein